MNLGTLLKWGAIILVAWVAWNWISNNLLNQQQAGPIPNGQWAPPLYRNWYNGATGWIPPQDIGRYPSRNRGGSGPRNGGAAPRKKRKGPTPQGTLV